LEAIKKVSITTANPSVSATDYIKPKLTPAVIAPDKRKKAKRPKPTNSRILISRTQITFKPKTSTTTFSTTVQ
jgi:hypothetical protein